MTYQFTTPPPLIGLALKHDARTHVLSSLWGIPKHKCKELYRHVRGDSPASGRKPDSLEWYFSPREQVASSMIIRLYDTIYERTKDRNYSFVTAYDLYVRLANESEPAVNINRWFFLWQSILFGRKHASQSGQRSELDFARCKVCKAEMLIPAYVIKQSFVCPCCDGGLDKSGKHIMYRRDRDIANSVNSTR